MNDVWSWLGKNWFLTIFSITSLIEISPIKFNPWSLLLNYLTKKTNNDLRDDIAAIKDEQKTQRTMIVTNEKDRIRHEVLNFANSCRNGILHTQDEFEHIIAINDKYEELLKQTGDKNGVFEAEYKYIVRLYVENQNTNGFLK